MLKFVASFYDGANPRYYVAEYLKGDYVRDIGPFKNQKALLEGICRTAIGRHFVLEFEASAVAALSGLTTTLEDDKAVTFNAA